MLAATPADMWWILFLLSHVMGIVFGPEKFQDTEVRQIAHSSEKRTPHETKLSEIVPTTQYILPNIVLCQHH
jgi:hypothetical protein